MSSRQLPRITLVGLLLCSHAYGAMQLVKDINPAVTSGTPIQFSTLVALNGITLGTVDDGVHGQELWRTDGTPAGTVLVKDIAPGPLSPGIAHLTIMGGVVYFIANDLTNGIQLWRSDGTEAGTRIVAAITGNSNSGVADEGSTSAPLTTLQGILYFTGIDATGSGLWRSDGTAAGTYRLSPPGTTGSGVLATNQRVFFVGHDTASGDELWVSDGTMAGTKRVQDFYPGAQGSDIADMTVTSAGLFYTAYNGTAGRKLCFVSADGSGVHVVADVGQGGGSSNVFAMTAFGADVLFSANTPTANDLKTFRASSSTMTQLATGAQANVGFVNFGNFALFTVGSVPNGSFELWTTDGTPAGTMRLGAAYGLMVPRSMGGPFPSGVVGSDGIYFTASTGSNPYPRALWRTDGTDAGTLQYAALPANFVDSDLAQFQGKIFLAAGGADTGEELWVSDGTPAGTHLFADLVPGPGSSSPLGLSVVNSRLFFVAYTGVGFNIWTSDGTVPGTVPLTSTPPSLQVGTGSSPSQLVPVGNTLYFSADDGIHGRELWSTDGTSAGTALFDDINPGAAQGFDAMFVGGGLFLFTANDGVHGYELWTSDGSVAGTHLVKDINPGLADSSINVQNDGLVVLNGFAYFAADDGTHGWELWRSDSTAAGTYMIADLNPGAPASLPHSFRTLNNRVLFVADIGNGGQWWTTDGTAAGTQLVAPAVYAQDISVIFNGTLYFAGQQSPPAPTRGELWATDGTQAGTHLAVALAPDKAQSVLDAIYPAGTRMLLHLYDGQTYQLFSSDGTAAGTSVLSNDSPQDAPVWNGSQLFYRVGASDQQILRATDGTIAGTHDVVNDPSTGNGATLYLYKNSVIFTKLDPAIGTSIWRTDGTAAGTKLVAAINGRQFQAFNNSLFFAGITNAVGEELFAIDEASPNTADDVASTPAVTAVKIPVLANDGSLVNDLDPNSVVVTVTPGHGTATVVSGTGEISYSPAAGFSGVDQFSYTVMDTLGHVSSPANVYVTVAAAAGPPPGTAPPPVTPPTGGTSSGGHSGGGSLSELQIALLAMLWAFSVIRGRSIKMSRHRQNSGMA
jgi:ELWxxDGT repeat protein